jgi:hypothetical protein
MVSPNAYNGLGVGTTQLYNETVVYNRKRHGRFTLDGRTYDFRLRASVPPRLTEEVLMVDLLHNLDRLAEGTRMAHVHALLGALRAAPVGSKATLGVRCGVAPLEVSITIGDRPAK